MYGWKNSQRINKLKTPLTAPPTSIAKKKNFAQFRIVTTKSPPISQYICPYFINALLKKLFLILTNT